MIYFVYAVSAFALRLLLRQVVEVGGTTLHGERLLTTYRSLNNWNSPDNRKTNWWQRFRLADELRCGDTLQEL